MLLGSVSIMTPVRSALDAAGTNRVAGIRPGTCMESNQSQIETCTHREGHEREARQ